MFLNVQEAAAIIGKESGGEPRAGFSMDAEPTYSIFLLRVNDMLSISGVKNVRNSLYHN